MPLAAYQDLTLNNGSRLKEEIQLIDKSGVPLNITPYQYTLLIKESETTEEVLYEAELVKTDNAMGIITIEVCPTDLVVTYPVLFYWITQTNPVYSCDITEVMTGKLLFK